MIRPRRRDPLDIPYHNSRNYTTVLILSGVWYESSHPGRIGLTFSVFDHYNTDINIEERRDELEFVE
jgi:hypothetical protein